MIGRDLHIFFLSFFLCLILMEHSSHSQLVKQSDWLNQQDLRPAQPLYTVTFNGQTYNGVEAGQLLDSLKMELDNSVQSIDLSIILESA